MPEVWPCRRDAHESDGDAAGLIARRGDRVALGFNPMHAWEQPWSFLTYMFLHENVLHLAFNMLMLFMFGPSVEDRMGGRVFFLYYLLCGLGGAVLSFLLMQWQPVGVVIGASGAILGVVVAFAWSWPNHQVFVR